MLNGLSLFSGIGGIDVALSGYAKPIIYCEIDRYCQAILLSRMHDGSLPTAPIWDDVCTFTGHPFAGDIDIIYGGFPCQDISVAGRGAGLAGERSGLFFEIVRLAKEIKPKFIFLENVPAITKRGGVAVITALAEMGYDCRWCCISAASVGALHRRERWFLLGHAKHNGSHGTPQRGGIETPIHNDTQGAHCAIKSTGTSTPRVLAEESVCDTMCKPSKQTSAGTIANATSGEAWRRSSRQCGPFESREHWQETVSCMGRVSDGIPSRVDRLRALGNAVVPIQVKEAFEILMGYK